MKELLEELEDALFTIEMKLNYVGESEGIKSCFEIESEIKSLRDKIMSALKGDVS